MPEVAYEGHKIKQGSYSNKYEAKEWNPCKETIDGFCQGGYEYFPSSATAKIDGKLKGDSSNVFIQGKKASYESGATDEKCSWNQPSNYNSGGTIHPSGQTGKISSGSSTVFVNGKPIAVKGKNITTHHNNTTTIEEGSTTVYAMS